MGRTLPPLPPPTKLGGGSLSIWSGTVLFTIEIAEPYVRKRVVPGLPRSIHQKAFAVLEFREVWLSLAHARGLGVL